MSSRSTRWRCAPAWSSWGGRGRPTWRGRRPVRTGRCTASSPTWPRSTTGSPPPRRATATRRGGAPAAWEAILSRTTALPRKPCLPRFPLTVYSTASSRCLSSRPGRTSRRGRRSASTSSTTSCTPGTSPRRSASRCVSAGNCWTRHSRWRKPCRAVKPASRRAPRSPPPWPGGTARRLTGSWQSSVGLPAGGARSSERPAPPGRGRRQFHGHQPAHAQAHRRHPGDPERGEQLLDVGGVLPHQHAARRDRAAAEAPQVGRDHPEGSAQRRQLRFPQRPVERVAVDQDHALAAARIVIRKPHRESVEHARAVRRLLPRRRGRVSGAAPPDGAGARPQVGLPPCRRGPGRGAQ